MTKPLSMDIRERLVASVEAGASCHAVAERFAVSVSAVIKLMQRYRTEGTIAPRKMGGALRPALEPHYDRVRALVAATPDITIDDLQARLAEDGIRISRSPLGRCLIALQLTRKKRPGTPRSRSAPTSPPRAGLGARVSRS